MSDDAPPVTKVVIETPPLSVTIEAPGVEIAVARMHAVEIYERLYQAGMRQVPMAAGALGFVGAAPEPAGEPIGDQVRRGMSDSLGLRASTGNSPAPAALDSAL